MFVFLWSCLKTIKKTYLCTSVVYLEENRCTGNQSDKANETQSSIILFTCNSETYLEDCGHTVEIF